MINSATVISISLHLAVFSPSRRPCLVGQSRVSLEMLQDKVWFFVISRPAGVSSSLASQACFQMTKCPTISARRPSGDENSEHLALGTAKPQPLASLRLGVLRQPEQRNEPLSGRTPERLARGRGQDRTLTSAPESPNRNREEAVLGGLRVSSHGPSVF